MSLFGGICLCREGGLLNPQFDRQTLLKTLPSLVVGKNTAELVVGVLHTLLAYMFEGPEGHPYLILLDIRTCKSNVFRKSMRQNFHCVFNTHIYHRLIKV